MSLGQTVVITLEDTVATRKYPFTQLTLDQIQDIRKVKESALNDGGGEFIVPAPVIIAEAIDKLHQDYFP